MWFSRQHEYRADTGAPRLVGPAKMIAVGSTTALPNQLKALGISGGKSKISELFMTQSRFEDRISALRQQG